MYKEIKGNLLDFPDGINIICHQCNCQNCFGAGIALQIKSKYREAFNADSKHYTNYLKEKQSMLGSISHAKVGEDKYVVNLYAQNIGTGRYRETNYEAFAECLERLPDFIRIVYNNERTTDDPPIVGFPRLIGCGLGGGSWTIIEAMLKDFHSKTGFDVTIVNFNK